MIPRSRWDDWQLVMSSGEALRKIILEYGQFPFWNPWHHGGVPLFSHPGSNIFVPDTLMTLIFGGVIGVKIMPLFYLFFGVIGMWKFLEESKTASRFWGSALFGLQGAIAMHIAVGHTIMISIVWLPWLLYLARHFVNELKYAVWLGVCMGLMYNQFLHYIALMNTIVLGFALINVWFHNIRLKKFYLHAAVSFLIFLCLTSYRFILFADMIHEYHRNIPVDHFNIPFTYYLKALLWPAQTFYTRPEPLRGYWFWYELGCYIGILALGMFIYSVKRRVRWWHIGAVFTSLLAVNNKSPWLPGYWLWIVPVFNNMFVFPRWRMLATFFIIYGAVKGLDMLSEIKWQHRAKLIFGIIAVSVCGLWFSQYYLWSSQQLNTEEQILDTVKLKADKIITISDKCFFYAATKKNIALANSFEPMLYEKQRSVRIPVNHPKYRGEFFSMNNNLEWNEWTPNHIVFKLKGPDYIIVNQNPGRYWQINGQVLFPKMRAFEPEKTFVFYLKEPGTYTLSVVPDKHYIALYVNLFLLMVLVIVLFAIYKIRSKNAVLPEN